MKQSSEPSMPGVIAIKGKWRHQAAAARNAWHSLSEDLAGINVDEVPKLEGQQQQLSGPVQKR
jgi:hypothetical protein